MPRELLARKLSGFKPDEADRNCDLSKTHSWLIEYSVAHKTHTPKSRRKPIGSNRALQVILKWVYNFRILAHCCGYWLTPPNSSQAPSHGGALLHHSDRSSQYTSEPFQRLMKDHGVVCSMSRPDVCSSTLAVRSENIRRVARQDEATARIQRLLISVFQLIVGEHRIYRHRLHPV